MGLAPCKDMDADRWTMEGARIIYHYHKHIDDVMKVVSCAMGEEDVGVV